MTVVSLILGLLPAIFLAVALLCGRYPGEAALARMRAGVRRRPLAQHRPHGTRLAHAGLRRRGELLSGPRPGRSPPLASV